MLKNIYELTDDASVLELVLDLKSEGWFVSAAFNRDLSDAVPSWKCKAGDPEKVKEAFDFKSGNTVVPLTGRSKFKVMTPEEYTEFQSIFGGGS